MSRVRQLRQADCVIKQFEAAADIVQATACALALHDREIGKGAYDADWFKKIYNGALYMVQRAVDSLPLSGKVPVAIFQLMAAIRSRPVTLDKSDRGFTLNVTVSKTAQPGQLPPVEPDLQRAGFSELIQCFAQIGGLTVDLERLENCGKLDYGKLGKISYGKTLGPLNVTSYNAGNGIYGVMRVQQEYPVSESWMKYLTWAESLPAGLFFKNQVDLPLFPVSTLGVGLDKIPTGLYMRPGIALLTRAITNAGVFSCDSFKFPVVLQDEFSAYIQADAMARGLTTKDFYFAHAGALAVARVAVESGQTSFIPALFEQVSYQLPEVITEASIIHASYRNGTAQIPIVITGYQNKTGFVEWKLPNTDVVYESDGYAEIVGWYGWMIGDYSLWSNNKVLKSNETRNLAWGTQLTADQTQEQKAFDLALFSKTISKGPLCQPGTDKSVGKLNMLDVQAEALLYKVSPSTHYTVGMCSLICYGGAEKDQDLRVLALFPLAKSAWMGSFPDVTELVVSDEQVPARRAIIRIMSPAVSYVNAAVTEDSAKYTALQQLMQDLNTKGLGANGLLSDVAYYAGLAGKGAAAFVRMTGVGTPLAGKVIDAASDWALSVSGRQTERRRTQRRVQAPAQNQGRPMATARQPAQARRRQRPQGGRRSGRPGTLGPAPSRGRR